MLNAKQIALFVFCISLGVCILGVYQESSAQERICPDGKRSYFGVCPEDGNNSRPLPSDGTLGSSSLPNCSSTDSTTVLCRYDYTNSNGTRLVGVMRNNEFQGPVTLTRANGDKYVGEFRSGNFNGKGIWKYSDGDIYDGQLKDGKYHGHGAYSFVNGDKYVGEFKDHRFNGQGTFSFVKGDKYVGEFKDGNRNGQGTFIDVEGGKYVGQWKDGKQHGSGTCTYKNGKISAQGEFWNGELIRSADGRPLFLVWTTDQCRVGFF